MTNGAIAASPAPDSRAEKASIWCVRLAQLVFIAIALADLNGPFLSAHNERQNQSFDMARHVYRDGWRSVITPKVSYVYYDYEKLPYMAALQEVPFNGLIMWPLVPLMGHERALARLIAVAFSLAAIELLYFILRHWQSPGISAAGATVFALSPLLLHFGQTPMPDVICTAGMLAAFFCALRGKLAASSVCFAFAVLAKLSVVVFGLPVLVALLVQRQCRSLPDFLRTSLAWGWLPLACLVGWMTILISFAPPTPMSISGIMAERGHWSTLFRLRFYAQLFGSTLAFGVGVIGLLGLLFAAREKFQRLDRSLAWAILISNIAFILFIYRKVAEPQYLVAMLPWLIIVASFGLNFLIGKWRSNAVWRVALSAALILHILVAAAFTLDLKASRVREYDDIQHAGKLLPADARVIVVYRYYGAGPAVWLDRNVLPMGRLDSLEGFDKLHREGFDYVLLLDIGSWHNAISDSSPLAIASRLLHIDRKATDPEADPAYFTGPTSPFRQYCDQHLSPLFTAPRVILYAIADPHAPLGKN